MADLTVAYGPRDAIGYESITVGASAIGVTSTLIEKSAAEAGTGRQIHRDALGASFTVETDAIRLRLDGTDPTSSEGHLYSAGQGFDVWGKINLKRLRMIRVTGNATVKVTLWGD